MTLEYEMIEYCNPYENCSKILYAGKNLSGKELDELISDIPPCNVDDYISVYFLTINMRGRLEFIKRIYYRLSGKEFESGEEDLKIINMPLNDFTRKSLKKLLE